MKPANTARRQLKRTAMFYGLIDRTDGCWNWRGSKNGDGYGTFSLCGEVMAHRVSYYLAYGLIPGRLHVLHHCDNPACVNPAHLFLGTHADNMADKTAKGRTTRGETNEHARLGAPDVLELRRQWEIPGTTLRDLSEKFGVSIAQVYRIVHHQRWAHI